MRPLALLFGLAFVSAPQDPAALIEQLKADDIEVRERAFVELQKLGAAAEVALKKAAAGAEAGPAQMARRLLRIIELDRTFGPALKKAVPDLSSRIALDDKTWTEVYLQLAKADSSYADGNPFPGLTREDLEPLAVPAWRHAASPWEQEAVLAAAARWHHRSIVAEVLRILSETDRPRPIQHDYDLQKSLVALEGRKALDQFLAASRQPLYFSSELDPIEAEPLILAHLQRPDEKDTFLPLTLLADLESGELTPALERLVDHGDPGTRKKALELLLGRSRHRQRDRLIKALSDPDAQVACAAAKLALDRREKVPLETATAMAASSSPEARCAAMEVTPLIESEARIDLLRRGLADESPEVRRASLEKMRELGNKDHSEWVRRLVQDSDDDTRSLAIGVWAHLAGAGTVPNLKEWTFDENRPAVDRLAALKALVHLKAVLSVDQLAGLTEKAPIRAAIEAAKLLADRQPDRLTLPLIERIVTEVDAFEGEGVVELLIKAGTDSARAGLVRMLDGPYYARLVAGRNLHRMGRERMASLLRKRLKEPGEQGCRMAVQVLGNWKWEGARDDLVAFLDSEDSLIRSAAIDSLGRIGLGPHATKVRALLADRNACVRTAAVDALGKDPESIPAMRRLLNESEDVFDSMKALFDAGDREHLASLDLWKRTHESWAEASVFVRPPGAQDRLLVRLEARLAQHRSEGARLVGQWNDPRLANRLLPLLAEYSTASAAVDAIVSLEAKDLVPDLLKKLGDSNGTARASALRALSGLGARVPDAQLRPLLSDRDVCVRRSAIEVAGVSGTESLVPDVIRGLEDPARSVRLAAVEAVAALKPEGALKAIRHALDDPSERVRQAARRTLFHLNPAAFSEEVLRRFRDPLEIERGTYLDLLSVVGAKAAAPDLIRFLDDPVWREDACRELGEMGVAESAAEVRRRPTLCGVMAETLNRLGDPASLLDGLKSVETWEVQAAACRLVEAGDIRGVDPLLNVAGALELVRFPWEFEDRNIDMDEFTAAYAVSELKHLNAIRNPEAWRRLNRIYPAPGIRGRSEKVLNTLAARAGFRVEWEGCETFDDLRYRSYACEFSPGEVGTTLRTELERKFFDYQGLWTYVLDSDTLRVIPRRSAVKFWTSWWAEEQKKLKK